MTDLSASEHADGTDIEDMEDILQSDNLPDTTMLIRSHDHPDVHISNEGLGKNLIGCQEQMTASVLLLLALELFPFACNVNWEQVQTTDRG